MKFRRIIIFVCTLAILSSIFPQVSYADSLTIKYDNKKVIYSGKQVKYTINGSKIKSKYPGIIIDGISLASVKEVFADSKIGLSYKFNKKNNTVQLKGNGKTLLLKINSNTTKVNGQKGKSPVKTRLVEFKNKTSKIYVPARYVANTFGLSYFWNEKSGIASMAGKTNAKKNGTDKTASKKNKKKITKESFIYNGKTYDVKGKKVIFSVNDIRLNNSKLPGVYVGKTLMAPTKSIFLSNSVEGSYSYDKSNKTVTVEFDDNILTMVLGSKTADYNGTQVKLDKAPNNIKINFSNKSEIYVPIENICELFEIDIETSGVVSTLSLPETDEDIEDINETDEESLDKNSKTDSNDDKKTTENVENNQTEKPAEQKPAEQKPTEPLSANKFPFTWKSVITDTYFNRLNPVQSLSGNSNNGSASSSIIGINNMASSGTSNFDTYTVTSASGFYGIKGNIINNQLTVSLDNMTSVNGQSYTPNIRTTTFINTSYNATSASSDINFGLTDDVIGYNMLLSPDNKTLTVKIYKNTVTEINASYSNGIYTFTLTALAPITVQENGNSDSSINLILPNIADTIGTGSYIDTAGNNVSSFNYSNNGAGVAISIGKSPKLTYYTKQTGNSVSIILSEAAVSNNVDGAVISLPSGIDTTDIVDEDNYFSNNFTITMPGDFREHFNANPVKYDSNKVRNVTVEFDDNGDTVLTFYTVKLYAYKLNISNSQIKIAIDRAKNLYSKVVVIDPGHGGHDSGTTSTNGIYKEKNFVLSIGYTYFRNYLDDKDLKVYWTRKDDTYPTLTERAAFAKKVDADIFISVHMNAFKKSNKPNGTEVYYSVRNNVLQPNGLSSYTMASMFLKNITSTLNTFNRGVKSNVFVVTNINTVPAVLIEYGFLTNPNDLAKFSKLENQDKSAEILYNTIEEIFDNYPTGR